MIIQLPDDLFQKYLSKTNKNFTGAISLMTRVLEKQVVLPDPDQCLTILPEQVQVLRKVFGDFKTPADLIGKILRIGLVQVQAKSFQLSPEQLARLKQEAFGHARSGEPRREVDATPAQAEEIVGRYMEEQISYFMKMMCSQL